MVNSGDITVTNHRLRKAMSNVNDDDFTRQSKKLGEDLKSELQLTVGEILKFYPHKDKCEVKLNSNRKITCLIAHDILSEGMKVSWFPEGNTSIINNQTAIIPSDPIYGIIATVKVKDKEKNTLLKCLNIDDEIITNNAKSGEYRIQIGDNFISITEEFINIRGKALFINGLPYTEAYMPLENYPEKEELHTIVDDTGWKDLTFEEGYNHYSEDEKAQYRRIGKTVQIRGAIKNNNAFAPTGDGVKVATITDTTCHPTQKIVSLQQGSVANKLSLTVNVDGSILIGRYGTTTNGQANSGSWLNCQCTYFID